MRQSFRRTKALLSGPRRKFLKKLLTCLKQVPYYIYYIYIIYILYIPVLSVVVLLLLPLLLVVLVAPAAHGVVSAFLEPPVLYVSLTF